MKYIKSKVIKKGQKINKYQLTIELSDYDIEMFEEFGYLPTAWVNHYESTKWKNDNEVRYEKMEKYLERTFHKVFQRIWREHDDFGKNT